MVSANLAAMRQREGQYLVGTPRTQRKPLEAELLKPDWKQVRPEVEVQQVSVAEAEETYSVPHVGAPGKRESHPKPIFHQWKKALKGRQKSIATGRLKDRNKMERRQPHNRSKDEALALIVR